MSSWVNIIFLCFVFSVIGTPSCTYYTEKQTEAVSQTVYATKDSIDKARFDLADEYAAQATRLVKPPKSRIEISYLNTSTSLPQKGSEAKSKQTKTPVIVVPERLRGLAIIVVNSAEYNALLQDKEALEQLKSDFNNLDVTKKAVDEELAAQIRFRDKMIVDLNNMKEKLATKTITIYKLSITTAVLGMGLVASVVLRFKGII